MINCTFENGSKASLRHVTVHGIAIKNHKLLLVKRAPHLTNPNKYGFPGGFVDRDETIEEAVKREVKEETGYDSASAKLVKITDGPRSKGEDRQNISFSYLVTINEQTSQPDNESTELKWFDLDNLPLEEEFAFDHYEILQYVLKHQEGSPIVPKD